MDKGPAKLPLKTITGIVLMRCLKNPFIIPAVLVITTRSAVAAFKREWRTQWTKRNPRQ